MKSFLLSQLQVSVTGIFMDADRSYALLKESLCLYPVQKYSDDLYNLMHPNCPVFFFFKYHQFHQRIVHLYQASLNSEMGNVESLHVKVRWHDC